MTNRRSVLWVDDDHQALDSQVEGLERAGFDITVIDNVDDAYEKIANSGNKFDAFIVDVMMATGKRYKAKNTNGGQRTGIVFISDLIDSGLVQKNQVIAYTIRDIWRSSVQKKFF